MFKFFKSIAKRMKGEGLEQYNRRGHKAHKLEWEDEKKRAGEWLPKAEYERRTGRPGKKG